jgi:hypothetical protein
MCLGPISKLTSEIKLDTESLSREFGLLPRVVLAAMNELEGPGQIDERK